MSLTARDELMSAEAFAAHRKSVLAKAAESVI